MAEQNTAESIVESSAPAAPGRRGMGAAVLATGLLGAAALPVTGVGIGWIVAAIGPLSVIIFAHRELRRARPAVLATVDKADRAWRVAAGIAALSLLAVAAIRSAGWLVAACLIASGLLASYALTGGRTCLDLIRAGVAVIHAAIPGLGSAGTAFNGSPHRRRRVVQVIAGLAAGTLLLLVFGTLLRSADPVFANLLRTWWSSFSAGTIARGVIGFALASAATAGAVRVLRERRTPHARTIRDLDLPEAAPVAWAIPIAMLDMLFGVFVWVQVSVLFAGDDYVLGPGGPDYAVYARSGSAQLGLVATLTLVVIGAVVIWVRPRSRPDRILLRTLGGLLCGLTVVVVASALVRLALYAGAYGFTLPRLLAFTTIVWLGVMFVLLGLAGIRLRATWFPRAAVASAVAVLVALAAINPEAQMARTHIDRLDDLYPVDLYFLAHLSADAVDALDRLPEPQRSCALSALADELDEPDSWHQWNAARTHARAVISAHPLEKRCQWQPRTSGSRGSELE